MSLPDYSFKPHGPDARETPPSKNDQSIPPPTEGSALQICQALRSDLRELERDAVVYTTSAETPMARRTAGNIIFVVGRALMRLVVLMPMVQQRSGGQEEGREEGVEMDKEIENTEIDLLNQLKFHVEARLAELEHKKRKAEDQD